MNTTFRTALALATLALAGQASADVTFYEDADFGGRSVTATRSMTTFGPSHMDNRASSAIVRSDRWEACENADFGGRCVVLKPGRYPSLAAMGVDNRISSVRRVAQGEPVADNRYAPAAEPYVDYGRRQGEKTWEVPVRAVHTVAGTPEQRCWTEYQEERHANVPAGVAGAVIGGILGHQIGGGTGRDIATVGGAVAGGYAGSRVNGTERKPVQRCENTGQMKPSYYEVTYDFRGREHHVQMKRPPGKTITVNANGEPREG
jgi:uncharacterized protein YcfJ